MVQLAELTDEEQQAFEKERDLTMTTTDKIRVFRRPYAHILSNAQVGFF